MTFSQSHVAFVTILQPFIRTKANEELTLGAAVPTIVCELGVQLQSSHLELQVAAAETLHAISTGACKSKYLTIHVNLQEIGLKRANEAKASSQDQRLSPQDYSRQVISRSGVVESATKVLQSLLQLDTAMAETQDDDPEPQIDTIERLEHLLFPIMELMLELSYWAENSRLLTRFGALECIIQILDTVHDLGDDLLPLCVEFLWNVLENGVKIFEELPVAESRHELLDKHRYSNASYALGSEKALETLGNLLILFFRKGYRKQDKELRNELVIVLVQLCRRRENRDVIRTSGLLQTINHYAIAAELGHEEDVHNYTDPCPEDFELKCLLWTFLATSITENGTNMALVSDSCLIQVLLMYILEESTESKIIHQWSNSQLRSLQFVALSTLHQVAVCAPEKFQEQSGHTVLLHVLKMMKNDELCRKASILLCSMCNSEAIQTELGTLGTIETMLDIFADDAMDAELKCNAVCLLSRLCRDHGENQTIFRRADGVLLLQRYLTCDEAQEHNLMIAVIGALWSCVVGNKRSEARFLQMEGVDVLLTILETCPNVMQSQVLGVLSDLLSNPKATMAFQSWKSLMSPNNAFQLLLNAWIEEEKRLNVERPMSGMLSNLMRPLDPTQSHKTQDNDDTTESPAFSRLMEALKAAQEFEPSGVLKEAVQSIDKRVKIYAVLSKVGFQLNREELDLPVRTYRFVLITEVLMLHYSIKWRWKWRKSIQRFCKVSFGWMSKIKFGKTDCVRFLLIR